MSQTKPAYRVRRPAKKYITPEEALAKVNTVIDETNAHLAKVKAEADHIYQVANEEIERLQEENEQLRQELIQIGGIADRLSVENVKLRQEVERLRGQRKKKLRQDEFEEV